MLVIPTEITLNEAHALQLQIKKHVDSLQAGYSPSLKVYLGEEIVKRADEFREDNLELFSQVMNLLRVRNVIRQKIRAANVEKQIDEYLTEIELHKATLAWAERVAESKNDLFTEAFNVDKQLPAIQKILEKRAEHDREASARLAVSIAKSREVLDVILHSRKKINDLHNKIAKVNSSTSFELSSEDYLVLKGHHLMI